MASQSGTSGYEALEEGEVSENREDVNIMSEEVSFLPGFKSPVFSGRTTSWYLSLHH